jgi:RNA polymerase sigma-70 factor (ECF subfamily)
MPTAPLTSASDDELVASFRAGDDDAFAEMYRRHRGPLRSFAARVLLDRQADADDVVQESFIRARHGLRVNDRPVALRPWLYMIVRNCAIDELRARRHIATLDNDHELGAIPIADVAQDAEQRADLHRLVALISQLPERQRRALVLRELEDRSHVQTAQLLKTTVPATKSLVNRARATLIEQRLAA